MGQRCVHYTERDNGTHVLYAPNQWYEQPQFGAARVIDSASSMISPTEEMWYM